MLTITELRIAIARAQAASPQHAVGLAIALKLAEDLELASHDILKTSTSKALRELQAEGKKIGGGMPYGYELGGDGRALVENAAEQRVIAAARRLRELGKSYRKIADELYSKKLYARPGPVADGAPPPPKRFDPTQIRRMLEDKPWEL